MGAQRITGRRRKDARDFINWNNSLKIQELFVNESKNDINSPLTMLIYFLHRLRRLYAFLYFILINSVIDTISIFLALK